MYITVDTNSILDNHHLGTFGCCDRVSHWRWASLQKNLWTLVSSDFWQIISWRILSSQSPRKRWCKLASISHTYLEHVPIFSYVIILFRLLVNLWFVERMIIRKLWENDWPLTINKRLLFWTFIGNDDYLERLMLHSIPQPYLREFPRSLRTWKVSTFYLEITCTRAWLCKFFSRFQGTTMRCLVNSLPKFDPIVNDNVLLHSQKVAFHKREN